MSLLHCAALIGDTLKRIILDDFLPFDCGRLLMLMDC